jgi:mitosis inhibitor protein kinase SWE1
VGFYFGDDLDESISSRFGVTQQLGNGVFSQVFKVEHPFVLKPNLRPARNDSHARAFAVKKSKKPYTGSKDREAKLREAEILKLLRGNEHVLQYIDHWEAQHHLYIQTEFCEDGNLSEFLVTVGKNGGLEEFRTWKILLELSLVCCNISCM